jgi:hypothetical protein
LFGRSNDRLGRYKRFRPILRAGRKHRGNGMAARGCLCAIAEEGQGFGEGEFGCTEDQMLLVAMLALSGGIA